jgi:hypothetical protein
MRTYLFGKDIEQIKRSAHNAVVFNEFDQNAKELLGFEKFFFESIKDRRIALKKIILKKRGERLDLEQLAGLERLQQLEGLERLQQLEQLAGLERLQQLEGLERLITFSSLSYELVKIKPNSVLYCDIPYINTTGYQSGKFDHKKFYDWAYTNPNPVFFSEYTAPKQFKLGYLFSHVSKFSPLGQRKVTEKLYCNEIGHRLLKTPS